MPWIMDSAGRAGDVCRAVVGLIAEGGIEAVSIRAVGQRTGLAPSSLLHHLVSRDRILNVSAALVGEALQDLATSSWRDRSGARLLPHDEESALLTRALLAFRVLGHVHPGVAAALERRDDLEWRSVQHDLGVAPEDVPAVLALVHGLREAVVRSQHPLEATEAVGVLRRVVEALEATQRSSPTTPV